MTSSPTDPTEDFRHRKFASEMQDYMMRSFPELIHDVEWMTFVRLFHKMYKQPLRMTPQFLTKEQLSLRQRLVQEEFNELVDACSLYRARDQLRGTVEIVDALGDLLYVICGWFIYMGIDPSDIMREIQLSNMSKLGDDGQPILREDGKVLKGPNYFKPDFSRFVKGIRPAE